MFSARDSSKKYSELSKFAQLIVNGKAEIQT